MSDVSKVPAKAKKPADRKPKAEKVEKPVVEVVDGGKEIAHRGITVTVPDDAMDDFELVRALVKSDDVSLPDGERMAASLEIFDRLFLEDATRILDALRGPNGRVKVTAAIAFVNDIIAALDPNS
jgi:hypothetical protein